MKKVGKLPISRNGNRWVLNISEKLSPSGKRQRKFFQTKSDAEEYREKILKKATTILSDEDISLLAVARHFEAEFRSFGLSLKNVCESKLNDLKKSGTVITLEGLHKKYELLRGSDWEQKTIKHHEWCWSHVSVIGEVPITFLSTDFLVEWMYSWKGEGDYSPKSFNHIRTYLNSLLGLPEAVNEIGANPVSPIKSLKIKKKEKVILTPSEVKSILHTCMREDEGLLPFYVLGIFFGLRINEITRFTWSDANFSTNQLKVLFGNKRDKKRFVEMYDVPRQWLMLAKEVCPILDYVNLRKRRDSIVKESVVSSWEQSIMRHTYGSYLEHLLYDLGVKDPQGTVALNMGHTNYSTYVQYYKDAVSRKDGERFWGIVP